MVIDGLRETKVVERTCGAAKLRDREIGTGRMDATIKRLNFVNW